MIKEVINVNTEVRGHAFGKFEILVQAKVHSPDRRSDKEATIRCRRVAEKIRPYGRNSEGGCVPDDRIAAALVRVEVVAQNRGSEIRESEVANRIN